MNEIKPIDIEQYSNIADKFIQKADALNISDMGEVMKSLKENYGTALDYEIMSGIVKNKLLMLST